MFSWSGSGSINHSNCAYAGGRVDLSTIRCQTGSFLWASLDAGPPPTQGTFSQDLSTCSSHKISGSTLQLFHSGFLVSGIDFWKVCHMVIQYELTFICCEGNMPHFSLTEEGLFKQSVFVLTGRPPSCRRQSAAFIRQVPGASDIIGSSDM